MKIPCQTPGRPKRLQTNVADLKNELCPHYGACLDMAVKCKWQQFDCSDCEFRGVKQRLEPVARETDSIPYYEISVEVRKV